MPEVREMASNIKNNVKRTLGEDTLRAATFMAPFVALSTGQTASLRISKHWSIEGNSTEGRVVLQWSY